MSETLKDYQVLDVLCGGTFYKVKHKVTSNIFAWKACDCSAYSDEQIQNIVNEVKIITNVTSGNLLRYRDTILHDATRTLYFVLEYNPWRSVRDLLLVCRKTNNRFSETFIWYLLLELAKTCKLIENFNFAVIRKCITSDTIYIDAGGEVRVDCFQLQATCSSSTDLLIQAGRVIHGLCYRELAGEHNIEEFQYSDDLRTVVSFVTDDRSEGLRPEVIIYHPTILSNIDGKTQPKHLSEILVPNDYRVKSELNKCDSEKAVEMCKSIKPQPRRQLNIADSPIYANVSPKPKLHKEIEPFVNQNGSLSPTLAALALELPGYVPRCRRPYSEALDTYDSAQQVSEETLSYQWMSRLIALREREASLNKRERDIVVKEIINSPAAKFVLQEDTDVCKSNGITLPPVIASVEKNRRVLRRRRRRSRSGCTRARRQSYSYEDLDSSLSADTGDGSIIVTATKFTMENMPRRNIFPDLSTKKVHFTPSNPFVGSDESVSLSFCELDSIESEQMPRACETVKDITKFKYLDPGNTKEGKITKLWSHSSPCKHGKVFSDITNCVGLNKTPSKNSLTSRSSMMSQCSMVSARSHWSTESSSSKVSEGYVSDRTRSSLRQFPQTPAAPSELKKVKSRKSLINFKTPFKFKSSSKV